MDEETSATGRPQMLRRLRELLTRALSRGEGFWYESLGQQDVSWLNDIRRRAWWRDAGDGDRARWLLGQLWHCKDVMPSEYCEMLDLPRGSSFARAARRLKRDLPD